MSSPTCLFALVLPSPPWPYEVALLLRLALTPDPLLFFFKHRRVVDGCNPQTFRTVRAYRLPLHFPILPDSWAALVLPPLIPPCLPQGLALVSLGNSYPWRFCYIRLCKTDPDRALPHTPIFMITLFTASSPFHPPGGLSVVRLSFSFSRTSSLRMSCLSLLSFYFSGFPPPHLYHFFFRYGYEGPPRLARLLNTATLSFSMPIPVSPRPVPPPCHCSRFFSSFKPLRFPRFLSSPPLFPTTSFSFLQVSFPDRMPAPPSVLTSPLIVGFTS